MGYQRTHPVDTICIPMILKLPFRLRLLHAVFMKRKAALRLAALEHLKASQTNLLAEAALSGTNAAWQKLFRINKHLPWTLQGIHLACDLSARCIEDLVT